MGASEAEIPNSILLSISIWPTITLARAVRECFLRRSPAGTITTVGMETLGWYRYALRLP